MLPQFPKFKPVELSDRQVVEKHTKLYEPYSDFNFTCLWSWDTSKARMLSELDGNLVVMFTDYLSGQRFLSFLGIHNCGATARLLLDYCKTNQLPTTLKLIPEISLSGIESVPLMIEESPQDFDYVLSVKSLLHLYGEKMRTKRQSAKRFWKENPGAEVRKIDCRERQIQQQILGTIDTWQRNKSVEKKDSKIALEIEATKRLFCSNSASSPLNIGLFVGGSMIGYALAEKVSTEYVLGHFFRTDSSFYGSTAALMQGHSELLSSVGASLLNIESDLGLENLRQSKLSWQPIRFLKRYEIRYTQSRNQN